jgi:Tol biopolymer transport system component
MANPNRYTTIIVASLLALSAATLWGLSQRNEQAEMLLEQAQQKELVDGQLEGAINIYKDVLARFPKNRAASAKALVQMGQCYEKLGKVEARNAYERVLRDYADQSAPAEQARTRLVALRKPPGGASELVTRKIWAGRSVDMMGSVSSDGRHLSYTDWETGDLAVRDLETGKNRRLTNKGSWNDSSEFSLYSRLSPDGKQVAYAWFNKELFYDLRLVALDQPKPRVLYSNKGMDYIQTEGWLPDGNHVAVVFPQKDLSNQIALVSLADGSVRVLKTLGWRMPLKTAVSPDGRFIAYDFEQQEDSPKRDISLLSTDGKRESVLIQHPANDLYPVWTPDGKHILFASDRTGSMSFWALRVADGQPQGRAELVKEDVGRRILPMGFTREGSFYYGIETGMIDVYTASLDFKTGKLLDPPSKATERFIGSNSRPDWSPDGRYLAYISRRGLFESEWQGSFVVCIRSLETGEERDLAPKLGYIVALRWSPDGGSILLQATDAKNRGGLYHMDVKSGNVAPLMQVREGEYIGRHAWSPDGKSVFYLRQEPSAKKYSIVARALETGQEREVCTAQADSVIQSFDVSPTGQWIVFWNYDGAVHAQCLKVVPSSGGTPRELVRAEKGENIPGFTPLVWSPDGSQVFFTKGPASDQDHTFGLWRVPAEGGAAQRVDLAMEGLRDVRIHPDGKRIAFSAGQFLGGVEIWVMENFLPR